MVGVTYFLFGHVKINCMSPSFLPKHHEYLNASCQFTKHSKKLSAGKIQFIQNFISILILNLKSFLILIFCCFSQFVVIVQMKRLIK